MSTAAIIPQERIQSRIIVLRGQRVLLDSDLAAIYEVPTKRLVEQVKRNASRFPEDFVFQLTREEFSQFRIKQGPDVDNAQLAKHRSQNATSVSQNRARQSLPYAFTEHGAIQAANILRSEAAVAMSVQVVRAFVRLRELVVNHKAISSKLAELDARIGEHDEQLAAIIEAIRQLAEPVLPENRRRIGFKPSSD